MKLLTGKTKKRTYKIFIILGLYVVVGVIGYIIGGLDSTEDSAKVIIANKDSCVHIENDIVCIQN
jgi:hypothetical protein